MDCSTVILRVDRILEYIPKIRLAPFTPKKYQMIKIWKEALGASPLKTWVPEHKRDETYDARRVAHFLKEGFCDPPAIGFDHHTKELFFFDGNHRYASAVLSSTINLSCLLTSYDEVPAKLLNYLKGK